MIHLVDYNAQGAMTLDTGLHGRNTMKGDQITCNYAWMKIYGYISTFRITRQHVYIIGEPGEQHYDHSSPLDFSCDL